MGPPGPHDPTPINLTNGRRVGSPILSFTLTGETDSPVDSAASADQQQPCPASLRRRRSMSYVRFAMLALTLILATGCNQSAEQSGGAGDSNATTGATSDAGSATETKTVAIYCGKCGEEKGTAKCCQDAETCSKCGLHTGTALCCKHLPSEVAGKDICGGCGQVAEGEHACDPNAEKCDKCGLDKGAAACCKL